MEEGKGAYRRRKVSEIPRHLHRRETSIRFLFCRAGVLDALEHAISGRRSVSARSGFLFTLDFDVFRNQIGANSADNQEFRKQIGLAK